MIEEQKIDTRRCVEREWKNRNQDVSINLDFLDVISERVSEGERAREKD